MSLLLSTRWRKKTWQSFPNGVYGKNMNLRVGLFIKDVKKGIKVIGITIEEFLDLHTSCWGLSVHFFCRLVVTNVHLIPNGVSVKQLDVYFNQARQEKKIILNRPLQYVPPW